ncbi:NAD(P)/FAD-dependent oxidoreductase [Candidatus Halobonum tyrrellensis]|uniref:Glycine/D-amino acid oxidase, deaminating n=1 Tax=Candidatus Halobonum tyrrellensis G22 TaxID=1324957 RepID=V4HD18_9EURY|nr:FAD-binding oxidoreductase [Candidatus Halobonum tyrrellensis]ESP87958.1 glycine/D-amino acid oxidase, deaminating [Candidatus Halobonum tyrrellensis G22]
MDVVVAGGGIVGVASAYELASRGADVVLCERAGLGSGSTDRAVGGIRGQYSTPVNVELTRASLDVWDTFEARFGTDIERRRTGYLFVTRESDTAAEFERQVAMQGERGVPSRLVTPEEAADRCAGLRPEPFVAGTYSPDDSFADPHLALGGYATAAREAGVDVRTNTPVTGVSVGGNGSGSAAGGRIRVETPDESLDADYLVNATGAWAARLAAMAGYELPVEPHRRQIAVVDPERPVPDDDPLVVDIDTTAHFRPERDGRALVGGQFSPPEVVADPARFSETPDLDWSAEALSRAGDVADYFGPESGLAGGWAGLYAVTPDHHPVIEESLPGVVTAAGFSGHGFQHAPATGRLVAELVFDGAASTVDVSGLGRDRFARGDGPVERNVA